MYTIEVLEVIKFNSGPLEKKKLHKINQNYSAVSIFATKAIFWSKFFSLKIFQPVSICSKKKFNEIFVCRRYQQLLIRRLRSSLDSVLLSQRRIVLQSAKVSQLLQPSLFSTALKLCRSAVVPS